MSKSIPQAVRVQVWKQYNGATALTAPCYCCCTQIDAFNFEASHVISDKNGGPATVDNLRPCCSTCNRSMQDNHMQVFATKAGFKGRIVSEALSTVASAPPVYQPQTLGQQLAQLKGESIPRTKHVSGSERGAQRGETKAKQSTTRGKCAKCGKSFALTTLNKHGGYCCSCTASSANLTPTIIHERIRLLETLVSEMQGLVTKLKAHT